MDAIVELLIEAAAIAKPIVALAVWLWRKLIRRVERQAAAEFEAFLRRDVHRDTEGMER